MRIANFVELPQDEYNNRSYTNGQPRVIRAKIKLMVDKPRLFEEPFTLYIIEPKDFPWLKLNGWRWKEVDHPAGEISNEVWRELVGLPKEEK